MLSEDLEQLSGHLIVTQQPVKVPLPSDDEVSVSDTLLSHHLLSLQVTKQMEFRLINMYNFCREWRTVFVPSLNVPYLIPI